MTKHKLSLKLRVGIIGTLAFLLFFGEIHAQKLDMDLFKDMQARSIGPAGMSGRVTSIDVVLNNPNIIYAGTASGGLWKSESGGINWEPIFDDQAVASIGAVAIYQKNPDIVWAGTGEGNPRNSQTNGYGVYRSLDGGKNWQLMGLEETRNIHRVIIHPDDPNTVYVGAQGAAWGDHPERGIFKTTDGGKTWNKILYINEKTGIGDLVIDPSNPNKLIAGMWEFRRWPWGFKSGGAGSGMYITYDGGENWEKRTAKDGLPKGELGRMGFAIAPSSPNIIYALIESKKNALYKSTDGGFNWRKINDDESIGNRPFYYYDIFADPKNENRIYSIHSTVTYSEDGGRSFQTLIPYSGVHPDHHAWWIHPEDPDFMIDGNDGGMAITRDRGKNWRFVENLPLAQFYHISVDNEIPYNVYGGMQDNGSWRGPAYTWRSGGIRNAYWEELFFGDGFDVMPHPNDSKVGYAMSQGGNVGRYDLNTGHTKFVKPVHPDGEFLRYNWNAAISQDPYDANTIYYGSQYVHKSTDNGDNWEIISPDLTTNNPDKQQQLESGGLTYDVTQAENNTTILAISPSPVQKGVIWVGTDDGNVQLTQDGGQTWTDLTSRIKDAPKEGWVPQIHVSTYDAGEAYVVINNYRQHDYTPYVFRTRNFGKSWERIADENDVWGYALSIVQDPVEKKLLFLGTEYGLYVSVDEGENWNKWTHGYPTASTIDLKIHPRENDLVIGTFGRAAFVLDDIRPLRAIAKEGTSVLDETIYAFNAPTAYHANRQQATGTRFAADAIYAGENRRGGAMLTFAVAEGKAEDAKKVDSVKIEILDASNTVIRTFRTIPDTGINRVYWDMTRKGIPSMGGGRRGGGRRGEPSGMDVLPGTYTARMTYKGSESSTQVEVKMDPRMDVRMEALQARFDLMAQLEEKQSVVVSGMKRLGEAEKSIDLVMKQITAKDTTAKALKKHGKEVKDRIKAIRESVMGKTDVQGIRRDPNTLGTKARTASRYLGSSMEAPTDMHKMVAKQSQAAMDEIINAVNEFFDKDWAEFQKASEQVKLSPFKEYETLEN